jgi:hypothetical protein
MFNNTFFKSEKNAKTSLPNDLWIYFICYSDVALDVDRIVDEFGEGLLDAEVRRPDRRIGVKRLLNDPLDGGKRFVALPPARYLWTKFLKRKKVS